MQEPSRRAPVAGRQEEEGGPLRRPQGELVVLVLLVGAASILMMATGLLQRSVWVNLAVGLSSAIVVSAAFLVLTSPMIGKMVTFGIIQHLCALTQNTKTLEEKLF